MNPELSWALSAGCVLVAAIARGSEIIIPGGTSIIQEGDHVVVVTNAHTFDDLGDILA